MCVLVDKITVKKLFVWRVYDAFKVGYAEFSSYRAAQKFIKAYLIDVEYKGLLG